jgi:hypothetical protein
MGTAVGAAGARSGKAGLAGRLGTPGENGCWGDRWFNRSILIIVIKVRWLRYDSPCGATAVI